MGATLIPTLDSLLEAIRHGNLLEHRQHNLELKENWAQEHGQKLSALANKRGLSVAWLVIGVNDKTGKLVPTDEKWARRTEEVVSQHINQHLDPAQACRSLRCLEVDGSWIVVVELAPPGALVKWGTDAYKAAGTTQAKMRPAEEMEFTIRLPGLVDYARQEWHGEIDGELADEFTTVVKAARSSDPGIAAASSSTELLTLLKIRDTNVSRVMFGDCRFRVVQFDVDGAPILNEQRTGLFFLLTRRFRNFIQQKTRELLGGADDPYSDLALREALANAVAHAAYFENDGEVVVELYPEKLAISNLCLPDAAHFANRWFSRAHKTYNVLLMEVLRLAGLVDELGRGKNVMFRESILTGKLTPQVFVDPAGRFSRWKLVLHGGTQNKRVLRLLERLREIYEDDQKALVAQALVLWNEEPVSRIRDYMDGESQQVLSAVFSNPKCPVFYLKDQDRLLVKRWPRVLLGEGKESKKLSDEEETNLYKTAYAIAKKHRAMKMTAPELRFYADMGNTRSEQTLASAILKRWCEKQWIERIGKGNYIFKPNNSADMEEFTQLIDRLAAGK